MMFDLSVNGFITFASGLIDKFGVPGIFIVSVFATASVFLPTFPLSILVFLSASAINPVLVGIAAGIGTAIGELVGYTVGRGGKWVIEKKHYKQTEHLKRMFKKYKGGLIIFLIAAVPIVPFDIIGLFCGYIGYDIKKFFVALAAGKTIRYTLIAVAGYYSVSFILDLIGITGV